jgi:hypothetical protein
MRTNRPSVKGRRPGRRPAQPALLTAAVRSVSPVDRGRAWPVRYVPAPAAGRFPSRSCPAAAPGTPSCSNPAGSAAGMSGGWSRQAQELAARPVQAGIQRDGHARHAEIGIEMRNPVFVVRRSPGRAGACLPGRSGADARSRHLDPRAPRDLGQSPRPPPRSTGIIRSLSRHQPKNGIQFSSRFRMKTGSGNSPIRTKVSQKDWCLDATISPPLGTFSSPLIS